MHEIKCRGAFQTINFDILGNFEIWDWGCGQGLASLTFIDMLRERKKTIFLRKVTLVEPSEVALARAYTNVEKACPNIQIVTINKFLPSSSESNNQIKDTHYTAPTVIHLFSNILDIETIDLVKLARIVATPGKTHYIMCVGPLNAGAYRIDRFASIFNNRTNITTISTYEYSYTKKNKRITCKANCFIHDGSSLSKSYDSSISPLIENGNQLKDDYDIKGWFKQLGLCPRAIPFYQRLEKSPLLNDHDSIFISPEINGAKIDMVLVRPGKGILLLKIYEGNPDLNKIKAEVDNLRELQYKLMQQYLEDLWGKIVTKQRYLWNIIRMAILFPDCSCNQLYSWLGSSDLASDPNVKYEYVGNKMPCGFKYVRFVGNDALTDIPNAMQLGWFAPYDNNANFSEATYQSLMKIISPSWHSYKEGQGIQLDSIQEKLAKFPNVTKQINGVAGSGKTQILVQRAVNTHIHTGKPVLILSYNITLANYIRYRLNQVKANFGRGEFTILNYHRFFRFNAQNLGLKPTIRNNNSRKSIENAESDEFEFSYDDIDFFKDKANVTKRYDSIFIDEIQDFKQVWIDIIKRYFLTEGGEIVVFGDASQNIYNRPLDHKGQIKIEVARNGWNNSLSKSHRFISPALSNLLISFHDYFISNTISHFDALAPSMFEEFKCLHYFHLAHDVSALELSEIINDFIAQNNIKSSEIAIVSDHLDILRDIDEYLCEKFGMDTYTAFATKEEVKAVYGSGSSYPKSDIRNIERSKKIHFTVENQCVKLSSIYTFKGWEIHNLFLIINSTQRNSELIYTALTRARMRVIVLNCGNEIYHDFFNSHQG